MSQPADFLVSYTSSDRAWAEWIAWQLESESYQTVIQAWDFTAGRDWVHEMQHATATAQRVVVVLSAAYLGSKHGEAEWRVFYAEDPTGELGSLVPVRVGPVNPPGLLKTRVYVDLVGKDASEARAALLAAARGARGKPIEEPEFPGKPHRPVHSDSDAPRFPGDLPLIWNLPYHSNPYFIGREELLADLHAELSAPNSANRRVALTGLGGLGKTQVAVEHAYRQRPDYDVVWWVRGERATLLDDYAALGGQAPIAADVGLTDEMPQDAAVPAVRTWLERNHRWLLVFDSVDNPADVTELLPRGATGHVLITSQADVGWETLAKPIPVEVLAPAAATAFLLARTRQEGSAARAAATTLASILGCLPLALEQAGAYILATGTIDLADYVELFATRSLELLGRGQPLGYQHTVATTWSLALQTLESGEPAAVRLLSLAAFLAPDDLPESLLTTGHTNLPEPLATTAGDPVAFGDAVAALRRYSLIQVVGDGLFTHRLLQAVIRANLDDGAERTMSTAAINLLRNGFPVDCGPVSAWEDCRRLLPHALAALGHAERLEVASEQCVWVLNRTTSYLRRRREFWLAQTLAERLLIIYERSLGHEHPQTLACMSNLAVIRRALGDLSGARELHEQTLEARRRVLGEDHPDTLGSMNNLATTRWALGDLAGASDLMEQVLTTWRRVLGEDHPDTLVSMSNLAVIRRALGDLTAAPELHEQTLAARQRVLGEDHPDTLVSMSNLAVIRRAIGDLAWAQKLYEQTVVGRRRVLGEDHPDTLMSMSNLAEILFELGDLAGARQLHEQSLETRRRVLGEDHPDTLVSMSNLAVAQRALGDLAGARELHEQTLEARRRVLGEDHPNTLVSMSNLAVTRDALGDTVGAQELYEQILAVRRRVLGEDHPNTLASMSNLAAVIFEFGDTVGAQELYEQILAARRRVLGEDHPDTLESISRLAETRAALGHLEDARDLHEQVLSAYRRVLGDDHSRTLDAMTYLAATRSALGDFPGAQELHERILASRRRILGENHPDTKQAKAQLDEVRRESRRYGNQ